MIVIVLGVVIARAIYRPLIDITNVMDRLAAGELDVEVPTLERGDEVGHMVEAVRVFKNNSLTARELKKKQDQENTTRFEKSASLEMLTNDFEKSSKILVSNVYGSATDLKTTANRMGELIDETFKCTKLVDDASNRAASNVSTVAAATQELAASINAITQLVDRMRLREKRPTKPAIATFKSKAWPKPPDRSAMWFY
jgi:methyl-accepting chemotaxis protein